MNEGRELSGNALCVVGRFEITVPAKVVPEVFAFGNVGVGRRFER